MKNKLLDMLNGQKLSQVPFCEVWFNMFDFCKRRYGGDYFEETDARIKLAKDLGMDAVPVGSVSTNILFGHSSDTADGLEHYDGGTLFSLDQLKEKPLPDWDDDITRLKHDRQKINDAGLACWMILTHCFHAASISMGLERFCFMLYDNKSFLHSYMEWVEQRNRSAIDRAIAQIKPDFVLFDGDCAYKNGLMVAPSLYRELVFDRTEQTVSHLKQLDIPYALHSDGKADELLPMLIELGFWAFHGCEKQANDLEHLVNEFGDDICLIGNMDVVFLANASVDEVKTETQRMLEIGSRKGKFIASCNTCPLDYIPDENYLAFCDIIKKYSANRIFKTKS